MQGEAGAIRSSASRAALRPRPGGSGWALLALAGLFLTRAGSAAPLDLTDRVFLWARGDYRSPLVCEFGGLPRRGLRRVLIAPVPPRLGERGLRITFFDLEAEGATRCFDELGRTQPNLIGVLELEPLRRGRSDTAERDFRVELRRHHGFTLRIRRGRLRVRPVGSGEGQPREIDFAGGTARIERIPPGSDWARLLADLRGGHPRLLRLEPPRGDPLIVPLLEVRRR